MKRLIIFFIFFILFSVQSFGQNNSPYKGLNQLLNTDFFEKFDDLKNEIEDKAIQIKLVEYKYEEGELETLIDSYNASVKYYNKILEDMKNDLLNRKERKKMLAYPDAYAANLGVKLEKAEEFYANTFQEEYFNITGNTATIPWGLIGEIIKYSQVAVEIMKTVKAEIKRYNETLLDTHLIEPHRFRTWDEIES